MIDMDTILKKVDSLPPLPGTAVRLISAVNDPKVSINQIVEIIKYDQALTARILRLCNSAYFGLSRQITSLNDALVCLGTSKLLQIVMAVHTSGVLSGRQAGYDLAIGELWKHSVAVAHASAYFAKRTKLDNTNVAFTAGLLHDIGKVVLSEYVADEFSRILTLVSKENRAFVEAEREVLGIDHTQIGAAVAEKWDLPEPLVRCIRYHHDPSELETPDPLVDAVYLANCICLLLGIGLGADGLSYRADAEVTRRAGLKESDLEEAGAAVLFELGQLAEMFDDDASGMRVHETTSA